MTPAKKILSMIETVNPADTAKLDEIDARVWCYLNPDEVGKYYHTVEEYLRGVDITRKGGEKGLEKRHLEYTRSRDALKAIRPDGWVIQIRTHQNMNYFSYVRDTQHYKGRIFTTPNLPSEELAELHAIIQAIEFERSK